MANRILTDEGWEQRIRDKMSIDVAYLPDTVIQQPDIITVGELNIIKVIPEYASLEDDDKIYLEAATICECARLLCPGMRSRLPKKEQGPAYTVELDTDWEKFAADMSIERDSNLGNIAAVINSGKFFGFDLSGRV